MSAGHTPGPWRTVPCPSCNPTCGKLMIDGPQNTDGRFYAPDAKLIASAPDLAQALEAILSRVEDPDLAGEPFAGAVAALRKAGLLPQAAVNDATKPNPPTAPEQQAKIEALAQALKLMLDTQDREATDPATCAARAALRLVGQP